MKTSSRLSVKIIKRIVFISIILVCLFVVGVWANKSDVNYITIEFPEGIETVVASSSVNVQDILAENHIIILEDEVVYPDTKDNIDFTKTITISKITDEKKVVAEEVERISKEQILGKYVTITEKIVVEQVEIPYETVTKDVSASGTETQDRVVQEGRNGIKELKYKVKFQNDEEVERNLISETVVREPREKIIQISTKIVSRGGVSRSAENLAASTNGATPEVRTMNASAYCSCAACCGKTNGVTSSGAIAQPNHTIAAGPGLPIGTVIYIPALAGQPNGGWFRVEDRGGAISNNRIDIFMGSHAAALQFGRRNLECYVYYQ
jgi:3D (Asp-Asp-Asp) domain-containing protein